MKHIQRKQRLVPAAPNADGVSVVYSDNPAGTRRVHCPKCREVVTATKQGGDGVRLVCPRCAAVISSELF